MRTIIGPASGRKNRMALTTGLVLLLWLTGIDPALAHRVMIFAWIDGSTVHTQSRFPGDRAVSAGEIIVCDSDGNRLLSGRTDGEGQFSFDLDRVAGPGPLQIKLVAGMGHQASWKISAEEVAAARAGRSEAAPLPVMDKTGAEPAHKSGPDSPEAVAAAEPLSPGRGPCLSEADVQRIVDASLDRKLSPVMRMLVTIQEKMAVGLDDIMAGIGYILGLTGVAAYAYARGKKG